MDFKNKNLSTEQTTLTLRETYYYFKCIILLKIIVYANFLKKKINFNIISGLSHGVKFLKKFHHLVTFYNSFHISFEKEIPRAEVQICIG